MIYLISKQIIIIQYLDKVSKKQKNIKSKSSMLEANLKEIPKIDNTFKNLTESMSVGIRVTEQTGLEHFIG